jgi:N utilization substance protein B
MATDLRETPSDRAPRRTDTKSPHRARARALKILFQADVRGVSPQVTLQRLVDEPAAREILDAVDDLSSSGELLPPVVEGAMDVELVSSDHTDAGTSATSVGAAAQGEADDGAALDDFTRTLVAGVHNDRTRIDALIARFARKWQISRMPVVDRTVLRLATYELIHEDTSPAIVIDEAVGLAKAMSTDDSGRYVNGVLESIRRELTENPLPRDIPDDSAEAEELAQLAGAPVGLDDVGAVGAVGASAEAADEAPDDVDDSAEAADAAPDDVDDSAEAVVDTPTEPEAVDEDPPPSEADAGSGESPPSPFEDDRPHLDIAAQPSLFGDSVGR